MFHYDVSRSGIVTGLSGQSLVCLYKITTFVTSIADWRALGDEQHSVFQEFFKGRYPANTLVEIGALAETGLDVEIEAIVVLD